MRHDLDDEQLRSLLTWHSEYRREWDQTPNSYADHGLVQWGRSRRLGLLRLGHIKAYVGVQHVDPDKPGWGIVEEPQARFFISLFVSGNCVTLRTFPTMHEALQTLMGYLSNDAD